MSVTTDESPLILLVDDNRMYRESVRRNLEFEDYRVVEAQDKADALDKMREISPDLIITDLDMKTPTEGLDLIREVKSAYPIIPIILISAVGTFDEGALAREYGATYVISKSRIEAEVDKLYSRVQRTVAILRRVREYEARFGHLMESDAQDLRGTQALVADLQENLVDPEMDTVLKGQLYDMILRLGEKQARDELIAQSRAEGERESRCRAGLEGSVKHFPQLHAETQTTLVVADRTLDQYEDTESLPAQRMTTFAYCFAAENEVKHRLGRKVGKFLASKKTLGTLERLYDRRSKNLDLFFNRDLLRTLQRGESELSVDLIRQVFQRIVQHGEKYKPDGLKALGVIIYCFGRDYRCKVASGELHVENPLNLRGLSDEETVSLASKLVRLQHLRNPYIHPEFTERQQIDEVRTAALECIELVARVN